MQEGTSKRDFEEGFELFCTKCDGALARYFLTGPKAGRETAHICKCEIKAHAETVMPAVVRAAEIRPEHRASPLLGMFDKSLLVRCSWMDMLSIIKLWWYRSNTYGGKHVMLTSDASLRDVGSGDYSKRHRSEDYTGPVYNTIDDFVVPPDLLIVQLGVIQTGTKDGKYFQGKLTEALYTRHCSMKPMWVVIRPDTAFSKAYYSYVWSVESEEIVSPFPVVEGMPRRPVPAESDLLDPEAPHLVRKVAPRLSGEDRPRRKVRSVPEEDASADAPEAALSIYGSGVSKSKKLNGRD